jgi:hypothetical protein
MTDFKLEQRVQAHPCTDQWMMGDPFGTVVDIVGEYILVKMDKSGKTLRFNADNLIEVNNGS